MIRAVIFDLDGTLVQTESLKAISYARAALELSPNHLNEAEVVEAFKDVVGMSRRVVAENLIRRFGLEELSRARMSEFSVKSAWQAFVQIRLRIYEAMLADPRIIQDHLCPYNVGLLRYVRHNGFRTGLATMSYCAQASRVLEILKLQDEFDFIATRDDVEHGKPDPEIYNLVARELTFLPAECIVIEDSPSGVKAALAAGMSCIVMTTDFTREAIRTRCTLDKKWIVDDPTKLLETFQLMLGNEKREEEWTNELRYC